MDPIAPESEPLLFEKVLPTTTRPRDLFTYDPTAADISPWGAAWLSEEGHVDDVKDAVAHEDPRAAAVEVEALRAGRGRGRQGARRLPCASVRFCKVTVVVVAR